MSQRPLYLVAYDVADASRLAQALRVLRNYATGGQKSVFECYLGDLERRALMQEIGEVLDLGDDRFFMVRLDPRSKVQAMGIAVRPADPSFYYVG